MKKIVLGIMISLLLVSCGKEQPATYKKPEPQALIGGIARESNITLEEILYRKGTNQYIYYNDLIFLKILTTKQLGFTKDEFETDKEYKERIDLIEKKKKMRIKEMIDSYVLEERDINMKYNAEKQRWESEIGGNYIYSLSVLSPSNSSYKNANFDSGYYGDGYVTNSYLQYHTNGKKIVFNESREQARARGSVDVVARLVCSIKGIKNIVKQEQVREQSFNGKWYTNYRYIVNTSVLAYTLIDRRTGEVLVQEVF